MFSSTGLDVEGGCLRQEGRAGAHSEQLKKGAGGGEEEGDRGGPNMTHVSVFSNVCGALSSLHTV